MRKDNTSQLAYWLALWRVSGIGPARFFKLTERFPTIDWLRKATYSELLLKGGDEALAHALRALSYSGAEVDMRWAEESGHHILLYSDPKYPEWLKSIAGAPPILFVQGNPELLDTPQLAMVGSRTATALGQETAEQFAGDLAKAGFTITSGLAYGIDAASHRGALQATGKTIAVLGTGLDRIYPATHKNLADKIGSTGALVSEFPIGTESRPSNFPRRNRLISGLSLGVLVVEAALGSGSLITARYALEQGREVFAIPGSIHNPLAKGCHQLLRDGAKLVEKSSDIWEELRGVNGLKLNRKFIDKQATSSRPKDVLLKSGLDKSHHDLLKVMDFNPVTPDILVRQSGLTAESLSAMLSALELGGLITMVPGGYIRTKQAENIC